MVRLYLDAKAYPNTGAFTSQQLVSLSESHVHYLRNVLRFSVGDSLYIYNEHQGEWGAHLRSLSKNTGVICLGEPYRRYIPLPVVKLLFSPLKHDPFLYLIEKTTEVGVTDLYPVQFARTVVTKINAEKVYRNCVEASQQCERLDVPHVFDLQPLKSCLSDPKFQESIDVVLVCQERDQERSIGKVLDLVYKEKLERVGILIGPEGGITKEELSWLEGLSFVRFCHLGCHILRAETAAVYALTAVQVCRDL